MSDIETKVKKVVVEQLDIDPKRVLLESNFANDLGADSLDRVELVMALEEEFGIEISDEKAESLVTVGDAIKFVETLEKKG